MVLQDLRIGLLCLKFRRYPRLRHFLEDRLHLEFSLMLEEDFLELLSCPVFFHSQSSSDLHHLRKECSPLFGLTY